MKKIMPQKSGNKTFVFIDASNLIYGSGEAGWRIDYEKLIDYLQQRFDAESCLYFGGLDKDNKKQLSFYERLQEFGYALRLVPVKEFTDGRKKADVDSRMTFELMRLFAEYDRAVVLTGDGDFYWVLDYIQRNNNELVLMGFSKRTAQELKKLVGGNFAELSNLRHIIERNKAEGA